MRAPGYSLLVATSATCAMAVAQDTMFASEVSAVSPDVVSRDLPGHGTHSFTVRGAAPVIAAGGPSPAPVAEESRASRDPERPPLEYRLNEFSVTLSRGPCDGDCPVHTMAVHGSGLVAYYDEGDAAAAEQRVGQITREEVVELIAAVYKAGVTELRSQYLSRLEPKVTEGSTVILTYRGATGSPRSVLTLTIRDFKKRIVFQPEYAPPELLELAALIEELAGARSWTGQ